jgi:small nuclear ribonucleoprotein (snRNP)-like protein
MKGVKAASEERGASVVKPLTLVYKQIGEVITVYLKSGEKYTGQLTKADNYMNLIIEDAVEESGNKTTRYGKVLIRGNNILLIKTVT